MRAVTVLEKCREYGSDKRRLEQLIARRRDSMTMISPRMDATGVKGAGGDKFPDFAADIDRLERALRARDEDYRAELAAACTLIDRLPEKESMVLYAYYVKRRKMADIAHSMRYSDGYLRKLKAAAEERVGSIPEDEVARCFPPWYPSSK